MRTRYALLAIILIQTLCASVVGARGSAITGRASLTAGTTFPCTLDVVLVTFRNATTQASGTTYDYHNYDRPYGSNDGTYPDPDSSYTLRDFERLFIGGYDHLRNLPFVGDTVHVANGRYRLPHEVFGSVRAYYDSVSNGIFQLHVRMINPADDQGYPRWVELPQTKARYAEIEIDDGAARPGGGGTRGDWFWDDAYTAAQAAVDVWYPDTDEYDLPNDSYNTARRLRRKVLYLYSGATYTARSPAGLLHPQTDRVTWSNPTVGARQGVGYRYVMGEREGWGTNDHDIDEFAGIGTHAHEIGHLLGLNHGDGLWEVPINRYDRDTSYTNAGAANMLGWTLMQGGGEQGPESEDNGYSVGYRSCPNPINPFYLMDLGWLNPSTISESRDNYAIAAGTTHRIDRGGVDGVSYLLNRRTTQPFGGRYLAFYDYAGENSADQGLMIWRREIGGEERPILIVADGRRYRDARDRQQRPRTPEYFDMLSDPFPGTGNITAVDALTDSVGLRQKTYDSIDSNGTALGENADPNSLDLALTNITYNRATDTITVDIYMAPPGPPTHVTAVVTNEQATLRWHLPAPSDSGPQPPPPSYEYRQSTDGGSTWEDAIAVAAGSTEARSQTIALVPDTDYIFAVRAVNPVGSSGWVRPSQRATPPISVSFGSDSYQAFEGGDPALVMVQLSPSPSRSVSIPVVVSADEGTEAGDYTVAGLNAGKVVFAAGDSLESFTITANEDADRDDETVMLSFEMSGGARATPPVEVTLRDNDGTVALSSLSPQEGAQLTAEWIGPSDITNLRWQWQRQLGPTSWINVAGVSSQPQPWVSIYIPQAGDVGYPLRATVRYTDGGGSNQRAESATTAAVRAAPPSRVNRPPSAPVGPGVVSVSENTTAIATYISADPDGDALGWTVSPSDTFVISGGALSFQNAPDYESGKTVYTATLKTYDGALWSPSKTVAVRVTDVDDVAPVLDPVGPLPCYVNEYCSFTFPAAKKGTEPITYKVSPPSWATASGRSFAGTAPSSPGTASASLNASNAYGMDSESLTIKIEKRPVARVAPVLPSVSSITCYVNEYCSFTFPAARKGTAPITYKVSPPSWATASGRSFSGTAPSSPGTASASLNASNAYGMDSESLTINIKRRPVAGVAPVLDPVGPLTCYVGEYCSFTFPVAKKGTAPITYKVSPPSWAKASGRSFAGTAPSSPVTASASLNASNAYGMDSESLTIKIEKRPVAGVAPVLPSVSSITCYVNEYCSFTFPAARKGTAPITYKVSPPSWATASGRSFSGTAPSSPVTASASLNASNAYGMDSESLTINIKRRPVAGVAPVLPSVSSITCYAGEYCSFTFPAATSGTAPITYKVSPPSWATASGSRGFAGTAPNSPGTFSASINASNAYGTDSESLTINVKKRGYRPVLASVSSITCYVGEYCSFTFPAATSGTKPITYKVSPPSWATASGRGFAGPAPNSPGTFSASINASNAYGTDSESLTIKVKRRLAIAPGGPSAPSAASGFVIGAIAGRIGMPARRPKSTS